MCIKISFWAIYISLPNNEEIVPKISDQLINKKSIQVFNRDSFESIRIGKVKLILQFDMTCLKNSQTTLVVVR